MAIFQPTNIIPSSFTQGTVDVTQLMEISWQVNGNSAMTAFQIDFYENNTASTYITTTGRQPIDGGFFGTDRFGRPQFFTYAPSSTTWASKGLTNGNSYKFKITQFYINDEDEYYVITKNDTSGGDYFFVIGLTRYVLFTLPTGTYPAGTTIYYNTRTRQGFYVLNNQKYTLSATTSGSRPTGRENLGLADNETKITQTNFSVFITRTTPTLTIVRTNENYLEPLAFPNGSTLATSIGYFSANYNQAQGDAIRWIRWQIATATKNSDGEYNAGDILADTGDIYTPTLNYEFNGFFNGNSYAIRTTCESESGQQQDTDWIFFTINIENQGEYEGNFIAQCLSKENAVALSWDSIDILYPTVSGDYTMDDNSVQLSNGATITYNNVLGAKLNLTPPWAVIWRGSLYGSDITTSVTFSGNSEPLNNETQRDFDGQTTTNDTLNSSGRYQSDEVTIKLSPSFGIRQGISIFKLTNLSGTGAVSYSVKNIDNYTLSATFYSDEPNTTLSYSFYITFYPTYYVKSSYDLSFPINEFRVESGASYYEISIDNTVITAIIYSTENSSLSLITTVTYKLPNSHPQGKLFSIKTTNNEIEVSRENENIVATITENGVNTITTLSVNSYSIIGTIAILENSIAVISHNKISVPPNQYDFFVDSKTLNYTQYPIVAVSIYGAESYTNVYSFSVFRDPDITVIDYYEDVNFKPSTENADYSLYMTANMEKSINGIAGSALGAGYRIYREEYGKNLLTPIATVSPTTTSLKDYGIRSDKVYKYSLHAYDTNSAFMTAVEAGNSITMCFGSYSLLVCDYDEDNDEYHVRKQYLFALDLSTGSVGNNNSPTLSKNFTSYPTRMPDTANYSSGTLQGLIGAIYTVPALIEEIGNYKWTSKPSTMDYFDSVDLEQELYDLSVAPYQLFLRDTKGRLRMIHTSAPITMTTNIKQKQQSISISLPWVEIGDASDVTIIQTPDDYGWNNDNQVLDVTLDVDTATGELSATYPFPYNGTKFYLTGVDKENLTAKTPNGVTPAQFNLSDTATETTDGEVTATVNVNTENN